MNRPLRFSLSRDAQRDLMELYAYLEGRGEALAGRDLIKALFMKIEALASSGHSGVPRDWISPGLRAFPYKNRCIYFRVVEGQLRVLRILHGRQDVKREMFSPAVED